MKSQQKWPLKRAKMEQHRDQLIRRGRIRGSIQKKSSASPYYVVRWREKDAGRIVKRSLYLGNREMAEMARNLLKEWQAEAEEKRKRESPMMLREFHAALEKSLIDVQNSIAFRH